MKLTQAQRLSQIRRIRESFERLQDSDYIIAHDETGQESGSAFTPEQVNAAKLAFEAELVFIEQVASALKGQF